MRFAGLASALLLASFGCAETDLDALAPPSADAGLNTSPDGGAAPDGGVPVSPISVSEVCARFELFLGERVQVIGTPDSRTRGTSVGCDCCNSVETTFFFSCAQGDIVLGADGTWPEVQGVVVEETSPQLEQLITTSRTRFGCVGQQCHEMCTPAEAAAITEITGVARMIQGERVIIVSDAQIN